MRSALVLLIVSAAMLSAQTPPPDQAPDRQPFRASTDLVEVDVVAQDRAGRFVPGLAPDDFDVREDGIPQHVDVMYVVDGNNGARVVADQSAAAAAPGDAAAVRSRPPRTFIAFFDSAHLTAAGFKRVQSGALTLFSREFAAGDMGGVVTDGRLANNRLTTDREELLAAVRAAKPGQRANARRFDQNNWPRMSDVEAIRIVVNSDQAALAECIRRACTDDESLCRFADAEVRSKATQMAADVRSETGQTLQSMLALVRGLSRFDGRKTILLLTEGFMAQESWPLVQDAVGEAARANARIYTLDARGLDRSGMADYLTGAFGRDEGVSSNLLKQMDFSEDAMNGLAIDTGGFVVRNQNYFDAAVKQIAAEAGTYYILGYRSAKAPDGKFRQIAVKVKRSGVLIRARRGYVATAKPLPSVTAAATPVPPDQGGHSGPPLPASAPVAAPSASTPVPAAAETPSTAPAGPEGPALPSAVTTNAAASAPPAGVRMRPDAGKHVDLLLKNETADAAAKAGWDAYQRGDVAAAQASLKTAAGDPSAHPWVHYALGLSQYALRDFVAATAEWESVRRVQPDFEPVYFDLVDGYLQQRDYSQALKVLRSAAGRWPRDPEVFNALGVVQTAQGLVDDAVKSFEGAVAVAPKDSVSHYNLGRALEMRYQRTRRYVQQLRAWVSNENDRTAAIEHYRECIDLGGAFAQSAQEALARLNWTPKP